MKKVINYLEIALVLLISASVVSCDDKDELKRIDFENLPATARAFVTKFYNAVEVMRVTKEVDHDGTEYDVYLSDGTQIEFDANGDWTDIDAPFGKSLPEGIVPEAIVSFVDYKYPGTGINEISRRNSGYSIELLNGFELYFDSEGRYVGTDRD